MKILWIRKFNLEPNFVSLFSLCNVLMPFIIKYFDQNIKNRSTSHWHYNKSVKYWFLSKICFMLVGNTHMYVVIDLDKTTLNVIKEHLTNVKDRIIQKYTIQKYNISPLTWRGNTHNFQTKLGYQWYERRIVGGNCWKATKWPRMCSICHHHNVALSSIMTRVASGIRNNLPLPLLDQCFSFCPFSIGHGIVCPPPI